MVDRRAKLWPPVILVVACLLCQSQPGLAQADPLDTVREDLQLMASGRNHQVQTGARGRLVAFAQENPEVFVGLLGSEPAASRESIGYILVGIGPAFSETVIGPLMDGLGKETDPDAFSSISLAATEHTADPQRFVDRLVEVIDADTNTSTAAAVGLYSYLGALEMLRDTRDVEIGDARRACVDGLLRESDPQEAQSYIFALTVIGLTEQDLPRLEGVDFGPAPDEDDPAPNYWPGTQSLMWSLLLPHPDALHAYLERHPGALGNLGVDNPDLVMMFSNAEPETQALREHLLGRDDLPDFFTIDREKGEQLGVLIVFHRDGRRHQRIFTKVIEGRCIFEPSAWPDGYAPAFSSGLAPAKVDEVWGFCDQEGHLAIAPQFDSVQLFSGGYAWFSIDGRYGKVNAAGEIVVEPIYENGYPLRNTRFDVIVVDGRLGLITREGEGFVEPGFANILWSTDGVQDVIIAYPPEGDPGFIDENGAFLTPEQFYSSR